MRLMLIMAFAICVFLALSLLFFRMTRKTYPGFGLWTTGVSLLAVGYLFVCLRGYVPDSVSIFAVNAAFPLGMVLHLAGMRRFLGQAQMSLLWYCLPGATLAAAAVFLYGYNSESWRALILSAAVCAPHWAMAFLILRQPVRSKSTFHVVIGSLLSLAGAAILGRAIWVWLTPDFHLLMESPVQLAFFGSVVVLQLGENLAFIMLNSERVENDLLEAETVTKTTVQELQRALAEVKTLSGLLPICSVCKKIRDDKGYWQAVDDFLRKHSEAEFSHGICPDCLRERYPEFADEILSRQAR